MSVHPPPAEVLAHRPPFLWIERCVAFDDAGAACEGTFAADLPLFAGHFPGRPVVPGVLLIEGLAQTLAYWALRRDPASQPLLTGVDRARFRRPVLPGLAVRFAVTVERTLLGEVHARGEVTVAGHRTAQALIKAHLGG